MNHKWNYQPPSQEQTEAAKALAINNKAHVTGGLNS